MSNEIPQSVLAEAIQERIGGRHVCAAVFTTFSFDPGFFELHILPCLFDRPFSQIEKVRRIQLEDALRSVDDIAVYYDRTALAQDAQPAQLDFRRIDVRRRTGAFHPKLVLLLVDQPVDDDASANAVPSQSLIVATLSANLTRAGWWENVETGHVEEVQDRGDDVQRCPFRRDLLDLITVIRQSAVEDEDHGALVRIQEFLRRRVNTDPVITNSARGKYYTRLFFGQSELPAWLKDLGITRREWNLEIISPYFDAPEKGTLQKLLDVLQPREVRLFLPKEMDGTALVAESFFVAAESTARWSTLPDDILRPAGRKNTQNVAPRFVHAKVYRLWNREGQEIVISGSINLTHAAHSHARAGNLEAAFLVDISREDARPTWWLKPLDNPPRAFVGEAPHEEDESNEVPLDVSFRFDWSKQRLAYRIAGEEKGPLIICQASGLELFRIAAPETDNWIECRPEEAASVRTLLDSTSFLEVRHSKGVWRVLVREEGMSHRPSLLMFLTPEEILLYWSLLSPAQREAFLNTKLGNLAQLEGLVPQRGDRLIGGDTLFDRFAGVFHAFGRLHAHVTEAIRRGCLREAEARLFGAKYDSLPVLLQKVFEADAGDPVIRYLTFLCARQVREEMASQFSEFWRMHRLEVTELDGQLHHTDELRDVLHFATEMDRKEFFEWYESMFLKRARPVEAGA